jgi:hypothetical protein
MNADGSEADWPACDAIVGNPPFLGDKKHAGELGRDYTDRLRGLLRWPRPGGADLVTVLVREGSSADRGQKVCGGGACCHQQHSRRRQPQGAGSHRRHHAYLRSVERRGLDQRWCGSARFAGLLRQEQPSASAARRRDSHKDQSRPDLWQCAVRSRADDATFGILHSRFHELWSLRLGTSLEDRPALHPDHHLFRNLPLPRRPHPARHRAGRPASRRRPASRAR